MTALQELIERWRGQRADEPLGVSFERQVCADELEAALGTDSVAPAPASFVGEPKSPTDVIWALARETLARYDDLKTHGWAVGSIPFEQDVRAALSSSAPALGTETLYLEGYDGIADGIYIRAASPAPGEPAAPSGPTGGHTIGRPNQTPPTRPW